MKGNLRKKLIAIAMVAVMAGSTFSGVASALTVSDSPESTYEENIKDVNTDNGDNISTPDEVEPTTSGNISTPDEVQPTTSGSISTPDEPIIEPTTESSTVESSTEPTTESSTVESSTEPTTESSTVESSTESTTESSTEPTTESSTVPSKPSVVKVKFIKLSKNNVILNKGKSFTLKVTSITPSNATNKKVTWNSSNKKIATVDKNGKVVARGKGTCRITVSATDGSGVKAVCKVTVKQLVTSIKLNRSVINLKKKGNKATLKATVNPRNADNKKVSWKVQYPKNVRYNSKKGIVKALRNNCYSWVTVISKDGSKKSAKALVVVGRKASKVEIGKTVKQKVKGKKGKKKTVNKFVKLNSMNIISGKSFTFSKKVTDKNNKSVVYGGVTWKSSNPKILTIDNKGKIKAIKLGSAYVTATTMDGSRKSVKCKVRVIKLVSKITFDEKNKYDVDWGKSITLKASVEPSDASIKTLKWKSSNTKVLTVNQKGKVTAKGLGSAVITASATDGSGVKVSHKVDVNVTMNTKLTCDEFQGNRKYVDKACTELNNYFKSCGAIINPKLVNTSQYFVTTSDSFTDGGSMKDFLVETVNIWTCQCAKDSVEHEGWKNFQGEGMVDDPKFIAFLDKIEEIGSSVFPTYDPDKMLDPEWNGWKQWFNTDPKVNVYVYVHQKDVLKDGSVSYEIRMSWSCLQTK